METKERLLALGYGNLHAFVELATDVPVSFVENTLFPSLNFFGTLLKISQLGRPS